MTQASEVLMLCYDRIFGSRELLLYSILMGMTICLSVASKQLLLYSTLIAMTLWFKWSLLTGAVYISSRVAGHRGFRSLGSRIFICLL